MTDVPAQVESHLRLWQLLDATERAAEITRIYTPDVELVGSSGVVRGRDELNHHIGQLQKSFDGLSFTVASPVMTHNDYAFYPWNQLDGQGARTANGWDFLTFEGEQIARIVMFIAGLDDRPRDQA